MNTQNAVRLGTQLAGRYRVDLLLSGDPVPAMLATRMGDGAKVLIQLVRHPLTRDHGPHLVTLMRHTKVAHLEREDLLRIHEFAIDDATQERFLVVDYERTRTAAQIVDPNGRERRTLDAFIEVAHAVLAQSANPPGPTTSESNPPLPAEDWVEDDEHEIVVRPQRTGLRPRELYWLVATIVATGIVWAMVFADERAVRPPEVQYPWYHNYGTSGAAGPEDPNDPFANDPDVIAARGMRINVHSTPSGADIWDGVKRLGRTPVAIERPGPGAELSLRVSKAGYGETSLTVSSRSPPQLSVTLGGGTIGDETAKFIEELKAQNKDAIDELRGRDAARGKDESSPPSLEDSALPEGLPKVGGKVPDIYKD